MQNVLIKNNKVQMILEWQDNKKVLKEDYPEYNIVYLENDDRLDTSKQYEYIGGTFEEVVLKPIDPGEIEQSPLKKLQEENLELKKQMEETQKSMAEMMNLIAMQQAITPTE